MCEAHERCLSLLPDRLPLHLTDLLPPPMTERRLHAVLFCCFCDLNSITAWRMGRFFVLINPYTVFYAHLAVALTDNYTHMHTFAQWRTHTHTVQSLFFVVFCSVWSDSGYVLCWSNSQTTVGALFEPSLLCDHYEGSPLCDQKAFLSSLSHSEPVWAGVMTRE